MDEVTPGLDALDNVTAFLRIFPRAFTSGSQRCAGLKARYAPERSMHVIARKRLNEFAAEHPDAIGALAHWYREIKGSVFENFARLRERFPHADQVGNKTVFNLGGNKYRLVAAIHYNRRKVYIRAILTHKEYDQGKWKDSK